MLTVVGQEFGIPRGMRAAVWLLLVAACGDNGIPRDPLFTGLSGSRMKLQWYLYQDGARQLETAAFYDVHLHVRCEPKRFVDDVIRCAPIADTTVFRDNECTMEVGTATDIRTPKYFVGHDRIDGELRAARLLRAGARIETAPAQFFERRDGACVQIGEPPTVSYFEIASADNIDELAEVWSEHMEGERLGLRILAGIDNLIAPVGYIDQQLGFDCQPEVRPNGSAACVPTEAVASAHFADPGCDERLVVGTAPPRTVSVLDANGCTDYFGAGDQHVGIVYRRHNDGTCQRASLPPGEHAYRVGAALELAAVERIVEDDTTHRLQRIAVAAGPMLTLDDRLYDTATRTDCRSIGNGELAICVPTNAAAGVRVFANDKCTRELLVADLPRAQCSRSAFAVIEEMSIHSIGAAYPSPTYTLDAGGTCRLRPAVFNRVPHLLGPPVPPTTFVAGVVFSERGQ
jgi:hypothetical protein